MTADAFVAHYTAVADASPVPVLLYTLSGGHGRGLPPAAIERLSSHPNIVGDEGVGRRRRSDRRRRFECPIGLPCSCGSMPVFHASLLAGARGGVLALACVLPDEAVRLFDLFAAGRHDEPAALQRRLTPLARLVTSCSRRPRAEGGAGPGGVCGGAPRPPLPPASPHAIEAIEALLAAFNIHAS